MPTFAVILEQKNDQLKARLESAYPGNSHAALSETAYLVTSNETVSDVAKTVGISGPEFIEEVLGLVLKLNGAYSGRYYTEIWDWFKNVERSEITGQPT